MDYRIEKKDAFTLVGAERTFTMADAFSRVPRFWNEYYRMGWDGYICPEYGASLPPREGETGFPYLIGGELNAGAAPMGGFVTEEIPAFTYAVFPVRGALPAALSKVNEFVLNDWLPNNGKYALAENLMLEKYFEGDTRSADYEMEFWIPVKEI